MTAPSVFHVSENAGTQAPGCGSYARATDFSVWVSVPEDYSQTWSPHDQIESQIRIVLKAEL